jgi:hypothetical protein
VSVKHRKVISPVLSSTSASRKYGRSLVLLADTTGVSSLRFHVDGQTPSQRGSQFLADMHHENVIRRRMYEERAIGANDELIRIARQVLGTDADARLREHGLI